MSSLYYRGNSIWIQTKERGKWVPRPLGISVDKKEKKNGKYIFPKEAREIQRQIDYKIALGTFGLEVKQLEFKKLSEVLIEYPKESKKILSPGTIYQYENAVNLLAESIPDKYVDEYTKSQIATFRAALLKKRTQHTVAKVLRHLSALFEFALKKKWCVENPVIDLKLDPAPNIPVIFFPSELTAFFDYTWEHKRVLYNQCMFLLLTGFRSDESCTITWDRIQLEREGIVYRNFKGDRPELFDIDDLLRKLLDQVPEKYAPFVFWYRKPKKLYDAFVLVRDKLEMRKELNIHCFKKTFATSLYEAGIDLFTIKNLCHHTSITTTEQNYILMSAKRNREALKKSRGGFTDLVR